MGGTPVGNSAKDFAAFIKADIVKWRTVVEKAGVRID
jgi:hypothetical protein